MIQTKNFNPLTDKKLICTCDKPGCDKRSVQQYVLDMAQLVRDKANRALIVTSGGRCPLHPKEINREKPADHQKCQGLDFRCNGGLERGELVKLGIECGFNAIGVYSWGVHLGHRPELKPGQLMMWEG